MKTTNKSTRKMHVKLVALMLTIAALLSCLVMPASAKSADGFRYYLTEAYDDENPYYAVITGHPSNVNGTLTVPEKLGGYKVDSIAAAAFADRKDITKVVLPNSWISVCEQAFSGCTNLKTLNVGKCFIHDSAFSGCTSLRRVNITGTKYEYMEPEYDWNEYGNNALFDAEWVWTRYQNTVYAEPCTLKTCTGRRVTLTAGYDLKKGESYHWYFSGCYVFDINEDNWDDCTEKTLRGKIVSDGDSVVTCEVTDKNGDVVWAQDFVLDARASLTQMTRDAIESSYLYGVTEYTVNHFRCKTYECLSCFGLGPWA